MSREILFRGRGIYDNGWHCGDLGQIGGDTWIYGGDDNCTGTKVDPSTVCQYTGFTGEDHKKIFEGDIVGFVDGIATENGFAEYEQVGLVEWYGSVGAFNVTERLSAESWEVLENCVVLGNRWDNPELLEGGTGEDD